MEYPESLSDFLRNLFDSKDFMPHGHCYLWRSDVIFVNLLSDSLIVMSYYSIPLILIYFIRKKRDLPFWWMFLMFGVFILACGTTHLMEIWNIWQGTYRLSSLIKLFTGLVSVTTAILLFPLIPKALALRSPTELEAANRKLEHEIKERKRLEDQLIQSEKMAAVGQLAGGIAHEVNNPLGVILGFAQGVVAHLKPNDPIEMPLKSIEREAVRCKELVQNLLTFSRVSKAEKASMDLKEAIDGAFSLVLAQSKVKNVEVVKAFSDIPRIVANKNQIQQILVNLSNNAIDAMPNGGKLTIRIKKTDRKERDGVEIQVQDTGRGIPPEIRSKIFNPFFTTKEIGKGTGLGLSLVYEMIQKHDGCITVESEVGKGTTFHVFLPLTS